MNADNTNGGCGPNCGHSESEHLAFDLGVSMCGMYGFECVNPYNPQSERGEFDAWETGASIGYLNYAYAESQNPKISGGTSAASDSSK